MSQTLFSFNQTEVRWLMKNGRSDYSKGYSDAVEGRACKPTSPEYLHGYEFGLETARIGTAPKH